MTSHVRHAVSNHRLCFHDDVIKWKHFPRNWPFVREIHRSPVNFPHKGQWRGALMFSLIYAWINDWVNNRVAGDLRRQHGHYDVIVMSIGCSSPATPLLVQTFVQAYIKARKLRVTGPLSGEPTGDRVQNCHGAATNHSRLTQLAMNLCGFVVIRSCPLQFVERHI